MIVGTADLWLVERLPNGSEAQRSQVLSVRGLPNRPFRWRSAAASRSSTHRLLQRVEFRLQLCEPRELQVEVTTVRRDLAAKTIDDLPQPPILSSFAPEHLLDLWQREPDASGGRHRVHRTIAQLEASLARCRRYQRRLWAMFSDQARRVTVAVAITY